MSRRRKDDDLPATLGHVRAAVEEIAGQIPADVSGDISNLEGEVVELRREVDELGDYIERNIDFAYQVYEWWQAGMPDEGVAELARVGRASRDARRLDRYARAVLELREPDGTWPTQEAVSEKLTITARALRDRRIGGWNAILRRAEDLAGGPEPTG